jgi:signal transduction histidine kinase
MRNLTIRARLTLVYSALLMLAGLILLTTMYVLVSHRLRPEQATTVPRPGGSAAVQGQLDLMHYLRDDTLEILLAQGGLALAVISILAIGLGWVIAGRLLRPLNRVTDTARRIADAPATDRRLHERIALEGPNDEVRKLADVFDLMLERLDKSFDAQRRFIANASHELRTPLTVNRALLEVAVHRQNAPAETRQLGETLLELNGRHERLIEGLLLLARSEQGFTESSFVDLADLARYVTEQQPAGHLTIDVDPGEAPTMGNAILLERLVRNLVENAIRYNVPAGGWVRVRTRTGPEQEAILEVSNTGPVVPTFEVAGLFEPFRRLETERTSNGKPGAGLGLSIVRSIVEAHAGSVQARARREGGMIFTVKLPPPGHIEPEETD